MRLAPAILACALLLTACGGSDEQGATATAAASTADDAKLAEQATLVVDDLPAEFTEQDRNTGDDDAECEGFEVTASDETAHGSAPRFRAGPATHILTRVYLFPDEPKAARAKEAMGGSSTARCFGEMMAQSLADEEGIEIGEVKAEELNLKLDRGDDPAASRVTIGLESEPISSQMVLDVVAIHVGRGMSLVAFVQGVEPFDKAVQQQALNAAADKLADAMSP